jgi:hypothetical protein
MRLPHPARLGLGTAPTVAVMTDTRCPRCWPNALDLGCDQAGHRTAALLLRAGWHEGNRAELLADLDGALRRLSGVGPLTRALVAERLS